MISKRRLLGFSFGVLSGTVLVSHPYVRHQVGKHFITSPAGTMATASQIHLTPDAAGVYHVPSIQPASYKAGSQLLQENHDRFHIFFNLEGFHNHIAHHLLTIFALGATPGELQQAFDHNANYMRLQFPINQREVEDMSDPVKFREYLGNEKYFHDFEAFFQSEIEKKGWEAVLNEYLFARDERADDLLTRMFAGRRVHPFLWLRLTISEASCTPSFTLASELNSNSLPSSSKRWPRPLSIPNGWTNYSNRRRNWPRLARRRPKAWSN